MTKNKPQDGAGPSPAGSRNVGLMDAADLLDGVRVSSQCTARSKRSGERCKRLVVGGGVCAMHGANRSVRAKQQARAAAIRARAYGDVEDRTPADALLASSRALDAGLQRLEEMAGGAGGADPLLLSEIRKAAAESARVAKLVQDAGLDERRMRIEEREQADIGLVFELVLAAYGLDPSAEDVRLAVVEAVQRVQDGSKGPIGSRVSAQIGSAVSVEVKG